MPTLLAAIAVAVSAIAAQDPQQALAISGRILHAELPIPGATVKAVRGERTVLTTTDENGAFGFANLESGDWTLSVDMRGFEPATRSISAPSNSPLEIVLTMRKYADIVSPGAKAAGWPGPTTTVPPSLVASLDDQMPGILSGSVVNGAASRFAQARAMGNNRPRSEPLYTGAITAALGDSVWNAGGTFGGPLRIPFLLHSGPLTRITYQHGVVRNTTAQSALVPTVPERDGDFSDQPVVIRDPRTGDPFAGNVIPRDRIAPQATALLTYYPLPTGTAGSGANLLRPIVSETTSDALQILMVRNLSTRTTLQASLSYQQSVGRSTNLFEFTDEAKLSTLTTGVTWTHRFSAELSARASYQFISSDNTATPFFAHRVNVSGDAGITGNDQQPLNWGPPTIAFPDVADLRDGVAQRTRKTTHAIGGEAQLRRGRHRLTFGGDTRLQVADLLTQTDPRGTLSFTGAASGSAFADFLLGIPATSAIASSNASARIRGGLYDAYLSDDIRLTPGITLEAGVRWEYESPFVEREGRLANLDVAPDFVAAAPVIGSNPSGTLTGAMYPSSLVRPDRRGFEPRLGLSWRPSPVSSLVIRAGYGWYRNLGVYQSIGTLLAQQPPFSRAFNVQNSPAAPLTLAEPFLAGVPGRTTFAVDPGYRPAELRAFQISIQGDLPASLTVMAVYFADRGTRLTQAFMPNTYPPGGANPCPAAVHLCPSGLIYLMSGGASTRNAGQVTLRRRLSAGFSAAVSYTLAAATDNAATFSNTTLSPGLLAVAQDWRNLDAEHGPSSFDQRHLMSAEMQYTTGVGVAGGTLYDGFWGRLYKDWTLTSQINAGSGLPVTPLVFVAVPGTGLVGVRPSLTGASTAPVENGSYANPAAFTMPPAGAWGTAGRNSIRGPSTFNFDMSVARAFRLGRRRTIECRVAAANVLNRVTFSTIDRVITSPQFGRPTTTNEMRRLQTSVRFSF